MSRFLFFLVATLLAVLPFHPFLSTFLGSVFFHGSLPVLLSAWKEGIVASIFLLSFLAPKKKLTSIDIGIFFFALISLLTGVFFTGDALGNFFPANIPQIIWGFKYGVLFFFLFFALRRFSFSKAQKLLLTNIILLSAGMVIFFGFLQATVLPENFLTHFGYSSEYGVTESGRGISYCHKIEKPRAEDEFCRLQSTLSGPNQLGAYLLFVLPFFLFSAIRAPSRKQKIFLFSFFLSGVFVLLLTFSRSAWIGFLVMSAVFFLLRAISLRHGFVLLGLFFGGIVALFFPILLPNATFWWVALQSWSLFLGVFFFGAMIFFLFRNHKKKYVDGFLAILFPISFLPLLLARAFYGDFFWNIILRPSSSNGHWERWNDGALNIIQHPFGLGIGDAGPASARFARVGETGFLPESWYLQVGLENGVIGLLLFCILLFLVGRELLRSEEYLGHPLFLGFVGISVSALFLHSWESAALALSFWGMAGVATGTEEKK